MVIVFIFFTTRNHTSIVLSNLIHLTREINLYYKLVKNRFNLYFNIKEERADHDTFHLLPLTEMVGIQDFDPLIFWNNRD